MDSDNILLLYALLLTATVTDLLWQRIPNWLTFSAAAGGIFLSCLQPGWGALLAALTGLLIGFVVFLLFYLQGGMRAGDVKLMAAAGCLLGYQAPLAVGFSLLCGAALGVGILLQRGGGIGWWRRYQLMFTYLVSTGEWHYQPPVAGDVASGSFPYASAIAVGCLLTIHLA